MIREQVEIVEQNKAILVGLGIGEVGTLDYSMEELKNLAKACDMEVVGIVIQNLEHPVAATYIGSGKAEEVANMAEKLEASYCIFEDTLSPAQHKNLQKIIKAEIMDRTGLILEIFSKRAKTREAKLQVETAKLQYMLPRLIGMWEAIGRQGGASGSKSNKGIGETQLELDRRWIQKRLTFLKRELDTIEHDRMVQRGKREKGSMPLVALVGYTNAGKSTIMNRLLSMCEKDSSEGKQVFEEDMLFATLDTSVRKITFEDKKDFLLSDTVGFVDKLPHSLVKAFRSTLEEIKYADLLIEVVDYSDERHDEQMRVTQETLNEIGVEGIPVIHVMNKIDKRKESVISDDVTGIARNMGSEECGVKAHISGDKIYMAAGAMVGLDMLIDMIKEQLYSDNCVANFLIPYNAGNFVNYLNENASIIAQEYVEDGVKITADVSKSVLGRLKEYVL